jgi:hypothetical protein
MLRPVHDVENVLGDAAFWTAFVVAAAGTLVVWLRMRRFEVEPGVWFVAGVATCVGLRTDHRLLNPLVVAIVLLALGDYLAREGSWQARAVALAPGSVVLGAALPDGWPFWIRAVAAVAALVGGVVAVEVDRRAPRLVPLLLAVGALGVYLCVPDTEVSKAVLGALVVAAALGLEPRLRHRCGISAVVGLFVWAAAYGGLGRPGSVVGGIACLGVVLLIPLVPRWSPTRWAVVAAVVVQVPLVVFVSRVAGFEESAWSALGLSAAAFAVGWVVLSAAGVLRSR